MQKGHDLGGQGPLQGGRHQFVPLVNHLGAIFGDHGQSFTSVAKVGQQKLGGVPTGYDHVTPLGQECF